MRSPIFLSPDRSEPETPDKTENAVVSNLFFMNWLILCVIKF